MKIIIQSEDASVQLEVLYTDSVAAVKAAYQDCGKRIEGRRDFILLVYKGRELDDERFLQDYGISEGSILTHIQPTHQPFRGINYHALAEAIRASKKRNNFEYAMPRENIWEADAAGNVRRLNSGSLISRSRSSNLPIVPGPSAPGRSFITQMSIRVGTCVFNTIHRMEGRWHGEFGSLPAQDDMSHVCSTELFFVEDEGIWTQRQTRTIYNGLTNVTHFWFKPVANGLVHVDTDEPFLRDSDCRMQEIGLDTLMLIGYSKRTGKLVLLETIALVDSGRRVSTVQSFGENGGLRHVFVLNEQRVVDAVSGALERYDPTYRR